LAKFAARNEAQGVGMGMDSLVKFFGVVTSIMVGVFGFIFIQLFAGAYLSMIEWVFGDLDDRRLVFAGGLILGLVIAMKALDAFSRWFSRKS
jgi:hypothetical protein